MPTRLVRPSRLLSCLAVLAAGILSHSAATAADPFTIAVIGDQQWPSRTLAIYPSFTVQTDWLAANAQAENLRFVTQVGDIIEGPTTDQWNRAEAAMATLDSATNADGGTGVPWNVNFGNHEVNWGAPGDDPAGADADQYRQYFGSVDGTHRYAGQIEFGGVSSNDLNTWHVIKSSNAVDAREYLMLNLEYDVPGHAPGSTPDPSEVPAFDAIAWAWGILEQHPGMPTIVTTHVFEGTAYGPPNNPGNAGPGRNSQLEIFDKLVKDNPQIFMVLSGHTSQDTHQVKLNASGLKVLQMVTDYTKWLPNGGNGYMRLVEMDEDTGEVRVKTYTPGIPTYDPPTPAGYRTDANGEFTVSMDWATRFPAPVGPIMGASTVDAVTDDGATIEARLINDDADAVTLVWAYTDQGASDIISWTSAPGGGSHAFGSALENDVLSRVLSGLDGDTEYRVRFLATAGAGSDWSSAGGFITGLGGSPAPVNFAGTAGTIANGTKVDLTWIDGYANETGFVIRRSTDPAFGTFDEFTVGAAETAYDDETTDPNTTYYYRIAAVGSTGTGVFTTNLEVTTGDAGAGPIAGLIGHWKFDDGSGSTALDSSVYGNDATNAGGGSWVAGKAGGAYEQPRFLVDPATDVQLAGAVPFSISLWVKQNAVGNHMLAGIDGFSTGGGDDMYALKTSSDNVLWYLKGVGTFTSTDTLTNYSAATTDGWVHVVGVYEPGVSSRLYINGALDTTGSGGGGISNFPDPFGMGRYYNNLSGTLNGALDDVQVYDQALSDADVAILFNNPGSPLLEAGSTVTMGTPAANAITADGATLQCQLLNANADDVTLVWAFADQGETTLGDWTTAPGGGSHSFGASTQGDVLSHALSGLAGSTGYSFRFLATAGADSDWSEAGGFTTGQTTLPSPVGFSGTPGTTATTTKVDLSWTDGFTTETGFVIRRSTDPAFATYDEFSANADDIAYEDDTTDPNTSYFYRIATVNAVGTGAFSANIEVTTGNNPSTGGGPVESLVGHWKFDDGSGSTAVDSSGNGNDASNAGGGSWVTGKAGGAYDQPRFTVPDSSDLQFVGATGFTVSLWVKQHAVGGHMLAGIDGFSTGGSDDMYALKMVSDKVRWYLKGVTAGVDSTDTLTNYAAATADGWVHVVGVYEPGVSSRLYINGALDNTGTGGGGISNFLDPFGMGRYYNNLSGVLNGSLDDVQVYGQALSNADVAFLYANPGSPLAAPAPTFADWIDGFELDPADKDFGDDVDGDRLANGVEAWFGTHPGQFNEGLSQLGTNGTTTTFEHPQNDDPPSDLNGYYEWSPNLNDWYASGSGPGGGATVSFVPNTDGTTTTVTATASEVIDKLFLRVGVMQN